MDPKTGPTLKDALLRHLPAGRRAGGDGLEERLERLLGSARKAWPRVAVRTEDFLEHLARLLPEGALPEQLDQLKTDDLFGAYACSKGDAAALALFEGRYLAQLKLDMQRVRGVEVDEAAQLVRHILFMPSPGGKAPALAEYSGRGDLRGWLKVIGVREAQRLSKRGASTEGQGDEALADAIAPADDPEVAFLKRRYRQEFVQAFKAAAAALTSRERNVMRHHFIDGMSIDQIGDLYQVHRATAARWLSRAREQVLDGTRKEIQARLKLDSSDLRRVMHLIGSRFDVSFRTLLRSHPR
ncbi:MAG: sigma factor-like helix-turn-helix DNA-binding protein [Myxococcaceae bacterium]